MDQFLVKRKRCHDEASCGSEENRERKSGNSLLTCDAKKPMYPGQICCGNSSIDNELTWLEKSTERPNNTPHTNETFQKELLFLPLQVKWRRISSVDLECDYGLLYARPHADTLLRECERTLTYNTGDLARICMFGKWHDIPRKQVAYGNNGMTYKFSGNTIPARPWSPLLTKIRDHVNAVTGCDFNFVLINRYADGRDHMGEHKDDERDLVFGYPIASLSLGQARDFVFRHGESRTRTSHAKIAPVKIELQHGSLLIMKHPTNVHWYHSLPQRRKLLNARINMTFRRMVAKG